MKNKFVPHVLLSVQFLFLTIFSFAQGHPPWESPLKMAWSTDGTQFNNQSIFQDSSGVVSLIRWKGDTLVCVFQWFRLPNPSPSWDRVAVKFSYNAGINWTAPLPIVVNGLPPNSQRPFDPTLAVLNKDSLRIFFSSSNGIPLMGLDSIINTYSAVSSDGIHYNFEPNARFDHPTKPVIDPAVIYFNGIWHYSAPAGPPQDGAYHATSSDGIHFFQQGNYPSDNTHNWTGNFMVNAPGELRFYGSGMFVWYNVSSNGGIWQGYVNTNIAGGDPSVVKLSNGNYLMIYTGQPYLTGVEVQQSLNSQVRLLPNPATHLIGVEGLISEMEFQILSPEGMKEQIGKIGPGESIDISGLGSGLHLFLLSGSNQNMLLKLVKL